MNGFEFLNAYNILPEEKKKKCKIVILSSSKNPRDITKAEALDNVYNYISKPADQAKLTAFFSQFLADRAVIDKLDAALN